MNDEYEKEKLEVICGESLSQFPCCPHGPTLLFQKKKYSSSQRKEVVNEYFACSAYRSLNGCKFYLKKSDYDNGNYKQSQQSLPHQLNLEKIKKIRQKIFKTAENKRSFCHTCNVPFKRKKINEHENHNIVTGVSDYLLKKPTELLHPLSNEKAEAQYFFTKNTLDCFVNLFKNLKISKVCCIGAPRLHEHLKFIYKNTNIQSFLLDIDHRFFYFFEDDEFAWFNMFNFHFFEGNSKRNLFDNFLKLNHNESVLLFIDPPFGCRTEPLVRTVKKISNLYKKLNSKFCIMPIIWIFPYFMEIYIKKFMPEIEMIDYKVNYDNHMQYSNNTKESRKHGSPVRIFTNIPSNLLHLPEKEDYKYCSKCNKWTGIENVHCDYCKECPSKNGETYRHCHLCAICVKPSYQHCSSCGRCTQKFQHSCEQYQKNLTCWICRRQEGHTEMKCEDWLRICSRQYKTHRDLFRRSKNAIAKGYRMCLICRKIGEHNENKCPKRKYFLKEKKFLSDYVNIFKKTE